MPPAAKTCQSKCNTCLFDLMNNVRNCENSGLGIPTPHPPLHTHTSPTAHLVCHQIFHLSPKSWRLFYLNPESFPSIFFNLFPNPDPVNTPNPDSCKGIPWPAQYFEHFAGVNDVSL